MSTNKTISKKLLCILLSLAMLITLMPSTAFAADTDAETAAPVLTVDVEDITYDLPSEQSMSFYVSCEPSEGTLTYQWFSNSVESYEGASPIEGATGQFYKPNATTIAGTTYYFAEVTNTTESGSATVRSSIAARTVNDSESKGYGDIRGEESIGSITLTIEDKTPTRSDLVDSMMQPIKDPGPIGYIIANKTVDIYPSDSMMSVMARACIINGIDIQGAERGYITSIKGRGEFDRGKDSGWMGTLNDWFTNEGFQNYTVANGKLKSGDKLTLEYTTDLGKDIGGQFGSADKSLRSLSVKSQSGHAATQEMLKDFEQDRHEYDIILSSKAPEIWITYQPNCRSFQTKLLVGDKEYNSGEKIKIEDNTTAQIIIGDPAWPGSGTTPAEVYTINITREQTALTAGAIEVTGFVSGSDVAVECNTQNTSTDGVTYLTTLPDYSTDDAVNVTDISVKLTEKAYETLPEGSQVYLISPDGSTQEFAADGQLRLNGAVKYPESYAYKIRVKLPSGAIETYDLNIKKPTNAPSMLMKFKGESAFTDVINEQPEGTLFQLDDEGNETGEFGFKNYISDYNVYINSEQTIFLDCFWTGAALMKSAGELTVDGEAFLNNKSMVALGGQFRKKGFSVNNKEKTVLTLKVTKDNESYIYNFNFIQKMATPGEVEEEIAKLPDRDYLVYSNDAAKVNSLQLALDGFSDEQKNEISPEMRAKLQELVEEIQLQEEYADEQIDMLLQEIAKFQDTVTSDLVITQEYYEKYAETIKSAHTQYLQLGGWISKKFVNDFNSQYTAMNKAYDLINKYEIAEPSINTIGVPTNYVDYFMLSSNAYNLNLGEPEDAYPISFKDVTYSAPKESGEVCLPWNTPGRIKYTIADESIVEIKEVMSQYTDMGLGGGDKKYDNLLYYLIPKKAGTTTIQVTLTDEAGQYYGQMPEIIIHVNDENEASIKNLRDNLTNIRSIENTTTYDTWYYLEGTEGAPFTFKVNGSNPKVSVWQYLGNGQKEDYEVNEDGTVTVLLKDGYNPIEVSAEIDGKRVTQVYGIRGKVLGYTVTNTSRPGKPLRQGDEVNINFTGITMPVHKILRIYNPTYPKVVYNANLPGLGEIKGTGTQYSSGDVKFILTGSGDVELTNGRIEESWFGSSLGSELDQGNKGEIAPSLKDSFSRLPDITLSVEENEQFALETLIHPVIKGGNKVKAGDTVTIELPDLDASVVANLTYQGEAIFAQEAVTTFFTTIPGLQEIKSEKYKPGEQVNTGIGYNALKTVTFKIPSNTAPGTYKITGGNLDIDFEYHWFPQHMDKYEMQIADLEIEVEAAMSYEEAYNPTGTYLAGLLKGNETFGVEWPVIGLSRADRTSDFDADAYYNSVVETVKTNGSAKLSNSKSTENSRTILALTAIGKDVTDVAGYNLLEPLSNLDYLKKQGINGPIWALIALDSHGYEIPQAADGGTQATRENIIAAILETQLEDGGWDLSASKADPDMTAMAVQALAPYYNTNPEVKAAIDKALQCLSDMQNENGGYESWGTTNSESCAQVIVALTALGIDPQTDARFIKNGNSVVNALLSFYVEGGGFRHTLDGDVNGMATEQGYYALAAYDRMLNDKTSLYDMSDVTIEKSEVPVTPEDPAKDPDAIKTGTGEVSKTGDDMNMMPWAMAILMAGAGMLIFRRKEDNDEAA